MKDRAEVATFIGKQFEAHGVDRPGDKGFAWHYGRQEAKQLLDFIYGGPPQTNAEELPKEEY